jgi:hypothetical protein
MAPTITDVYARYSSPSTNKIEVAIERRKRRLLTSVLFSSKAGCQDPLSILLCSGGLRRRLGGGLLRRFVGRLRGLEFGFGRFEFFVRLRLWVGRRSRSGRNWSSGGRSAFCLFPCFWTRFWGSCRGGSFRSSFGRASPSGRWRRRRRRRCERLQKLQRFRARAQLSVQQEHEHIVGEFGILGQLRRDQ